MRIVLLVFLAYKLICSLFTIIFSINAPSRYSTFNYTFIFIIIWKRLFPHLEKPAIISLYLYI